MGDKDLIQFLGTNGKRLEIVRNEDGTISVGVVFRGSYAWEVVALVVTSSDVAALVEFLAESPDQPMVK